MATLEEENALKTTFEKLLREWARADNFMPLLRCTYDVLVRPKSITVGLANGEAFSAHIRRRFKRTGHPTDRRLVIEWHPALELDKCAVVLVTTYEEYQAPEWAPFEFKCLQSQLGFACWRDVINEAMLKCKAIRDKHRPNQSFTDDVRYELEDLIKPSKLGKEHFEGFPLCPQVIFFGTSEFEMLKFALAHDHCDLVIYERLSFLSFIIARAIKLSGDLELMEMIDEDD